MSDPKSELSGSNDWYNILFEPSLGRVDTLAATLQKSFPKLPAADARFEALLLVEAPSQKIYPFHSGKKDLAEIDKFFDALSNAQKILKGLSPWASEAFLKSVTSTDQDRGLELLGHLVSLSRMKTATLNHYQTLHAQGKVQGKINLDAAIIVQAAARFWSKYSEKPKVPKSLNPESPFADFLRVVLDAAQVGAEVRSAFKSWRDNAKYIID